MILRGKMLRNTWALFLPGLLDLTLAQCSRSSCLEIFTGLEDCGAGCVADCSRWLAITVTPAAITSTITVQSSTPTSTGLARRQENEENLCPPPPFPPYAGAVCNDLSEYVSACSCIGAGPTTTTVAAPITTVTVTADGVLNPASSELSITNSGDSGTPVTTFGVSASNTGVSVSTSDVPTVTSSTDSTISSTSSVSSGASTETSVASSTTSDAPIILTVAPAIQAAVQTPAPGRRWWRRDTPTESEPPVGGFIGADALDASCDSAREFTIVDGELTSQRGSLHAEINAEFTEFEPSASGAISRTFVVINSTLHWQNETFSGGEAGFCQDSNGVVYATFRESGSSRPVGCSPISIVAYRATRCVNGVIVPDPDQPTTTSLPTAASSFAPSSESTGSSSIISSSSMSPNFTSPSGIPLSTTGPLITASSNFFPSSTFASSSAPYGNSSTSTILPGTASSSATPSILPPPYFGFCLQVDGRNSSLDKQFVTSPGRENGLYLESSGTPARFTLNPATHVLSIDSSPVTVLGCPGAEAEYVSFNIEGADTVDASPDDFITVTCETRYLPDTSAYELECLADSGNNVYGPFAATGTGPAELNMIRQDGPNLLQSITLVLRSGAECGFNISRPTTTSMESTISIASADITSETITSSSSASLESVLTSIGSNLTTFLSATASETGTSGILNVSDSTSTSATSPDSTVPSVTSSEANAQSSVSSPEVGPTTINDNATSSSTVPSGTSSAPTISISSDPDSTDTTIIDTSAVSTISSESSTVDTSSTAEPVITSIEDTPTTTSSTDSSETATAVIPTITE
ncbi:hypothetical protein G7054_g3485 [Neopestalotiopsis clavispora]|nr:hypothetical protein G7054_g3485 [Neopestalotiopsis clavispora]